MTEEPDWALIRLRYEAGETGAAISRSLGGTPVKQTIYNRAKAEGWVSPKEAEEAIERLPVAQSFWDTLDERQKMVVQAFALGARTMEDAAARAGVSSRAVRYWREDEHFNRICQMARIQARDDLVANVKRFGENEWRPNAWLLERLYKEEFGQAQAIVQGNTFNILGSVNLGIDRKTEDEREVIDVTPESA